MRKHAFWLAGLAIVTIIFGTMYIALQQSLRLGANDPQVQLAEDAAAKLNRGAQPQGIIGPAVDISHSQAPFVIVYDKTGRVVAGSGTLDGAIPVIPFGVLQHAAGKPYNFVTWQPQKNVRLASVSVAAQHYYVASARSLYEVEQRENRAFWVVAGGWIASVAVIAAMALLRARR